jgi:hypothetical protein
MKNFGGDQDGCLWRLTEASAQKENPSRRAKRNKKCLDSY